jgi:hypothetical protein
VYQLILKLVGLVAVLPYVLQRRQTQEKTARVQRYVHGTNVRKEMVGVEQSLGKHQNTVLEIVPTEMLVGVIKISREFEGVD